MRTHMCYKKFPISGSGGDKISYQKAKATCYSHSADIIQPTLKPWLDEIEEYFLTDLTGQFAFIGK